MQKTSSAPKTISPKQVAKAIGVSESSLKRWCDQGLLPMSRTAGGHRRLNPADVVAFIRKSDRHLAEPEILGLPASTPQGGKFTKETIGHLTQALIDGKSEICRRLIFDLYLSNERLGRIFDDLIAKSFYMIGTEWQNGRLDIYQERRAGEICESILLEIRSFLPVPNEKSPYAIGATPEGDNYRIANRMAELILRELGWNAISLGTSLPFSTIEKAVKEYKPKLLWLSISSIGSKKNSMLTINGCVNRRVAISQSSSEGKRSLNACAKKCGVLSTASICGRWKRVLLIFFSANTVTTRDRSRGDMP